MIDESLSKFNFDSIQFQQYMNTTTQKLHNNLLYKNNMSPLQLRNAIHINRCWLVCTASFFHRLHSCQLLFSP